MIDVNKLLNTVLAVTRHHGKATRKSDYRSTAVDARASAISSPAMWAYSETGALAGGLAGTLLTSKHARKLGGSALQIGAVALLGALAYKATATIATASRSFRKTSATRLAAFRRSRPARHNRPRTFALWKGIVAAVALDRAVREAVARCGAAFIETDMRAHFNPTRMQAIERATVDLVRRFRSRCPACAYPGFDVTERVPGLPCEWCGEPTQVIKAEVLSCAACGHRVERSVAERLTADPGLCNQCNP